MIHSRRTKISLHLPKKNGAMINSRIYFSLLLIAGATFLSCGTRTVDKTPPENTSTEVTGNDIIKHDIETVSQGAFYVNEEVIVPVGGIVITEASEWHDFLKLVSSSKSTDGDIDKAVIDFDREMVIGYFDEVHGALNAAVYIESVTEKLSGLIVNYYVTENNSDPAAEVLNQPYMLVRMKKRNKTVTFAPTF